MKPLEVEISAFLNQYNETFTTFDGNQIAALYCIPTVTCGETGRYIVFSPVKRLRGSSKGLRTPTKVKASHVGPCTIWRSFP